MKLEEILDNWSTDCIIEPTLSNNESLKTTELHCKYLKIFTHEKLILKKLEAEFKQLFRDKHEYYTGSLDQETLSERQWKPFKRTILKTDLNTYIDSDKDIIELSLKIGLQSEKVSTLDSIIRTINNRGFAIRNHIEWQKFINAVN